MRPPLVTDALRRGKWFLVATTNCFQFVGLSGRRGKAHGGKSARRGYHDRPNPMPYGRCRFLKSTFYDTVSPA